MGEFKLTRGLLSAYYISVLISYPLFNLMKDVIIGWVTWLVSVIKVTTGATLQGNGPLWFSLFFVCFAITFLIRKFVVQPLGFYINQEGGNNVELILLLLLVLGSYIYFLNQVFTQPLPEWPVWLLKLVDGYKHTYMVTQVSGVEERNAWVFVPWLWNLGPIAFMYFRVLVKPVTK